MIAAPTLARVGRGVGRVESRPVIRNLSVASKLSVPIAATAAGTTEILGTAVDTFGFVGVRFVAILGALTATQVTTLKVQGSADGATGWVDLADSQVGPAADADSGKLLVVDLYRPPYRYLRPVVGRGTANAVVQAVLCDLYLANREPVTQANVIESTVINNGYAGTA